MRAESENFLPRIKNGEFDTPLGNRRLLSVFFVVVVLLGVFFTTGYIVGKGSAAVLADSSPKSVKPLIVDSVASPQALPVNEEAQNSRASDVVQSKPFEKPAAAPDASVKPDTPVKSDASVKEVSNNQSAPAKPNVAGESAKKETRGSGTPGPAKSYLQVAATTKREADNMMNVLKQKGFNTVALEIRERPGTWRVFVGPVAENGIDSTRADLQKMGFPGNEALRRTF